MIKQLVETTNTREKTTVSEDDMNLYLAELLVIGLIPEPSFENYFKKDSDGIFGSVWMQNHFLREKMGLFSCSYSFSGK